MTQNQQSYWQFSQIPNIEESNFNKILERFYDMKVTGLVRENIQNSLDGKLKEYDGPVIVKIQTGDIETRLIPGVKELIDRIYSLEGRNTYTKETIQHMLNKVDQESVSYISFEDQNTKGLTGAKYGQSNSKDHTWGIYAYNKGVHFEETDTAIETARGGSHGVGKIASNAASDIHLMYFANCDEEGEQHLGGTIQLIEHSYNDRYYRASGYFAELKKDEYSSKFMPFENNFHEVFSKNTRGLKIIIPYLRKGYAETQDIVTSVCDSFFISIIEGKLEVEVNGIKINPDTIHDLVTNPSYYVQKIEDIKKNFTPLYVNTYLEKVPQELNISDGRHDFKFRLYFTYDERIAKGRVAIVRTVGMKIEDLKVKGNVNKPFNAVLIGGSDEDSYLKSLENESHTELSSDHIKDPVLQRQAKRFINNLSREISKVIEKAMKDNNPVDGTMDTKNIIYLVESQFKQDLMSSMGTVLINSKPVVKTKTNVKKKEKRDKQKNSKQSTSREATKNRKPLKLIKNLEGKHDGEDQTKKYSANPEMVERIIVQDREYLSFDFSKSKETIGDYPCSISLAVIDGMGVEHSNEFQLKDSYLTIRNPITSQNYNIENNSIKDVEVIEGKARLELTLSPNYNRALKFVYYVEVPNDL
ncbi:hypothetical protein [Exiguobacterium sp. s6]|uniref:hypothetical protein n=1 Tax=Exiguobacterium sp. s6 TaxID=2751236 RepID=UPI001BE84189|nr:hypothetical protein [Exiguobacterium sp. s6]